MSVKDGKVHTIAGVFDRARADALGEAVKDQERDATVKFEGQDLLVSFGKYLFEFVDGELRSDGL